MFFRFLGGYHIAWPASHAAFKTPDCWPDHLVHQSRNPKKLWKLTISKKCVLLFFNNPLDKKVAISAIACKDRLAVLKQQWRINDKRSSPAVQNSRNKFKCDLHCSILLKRSKKQWKIHHESRIMNKLDKPVPLTKCDFHWFSIAISYYCVTKKALEKQTYHYLNHWGRHSHAHALLKTHQWHFNISSLVEGPKAILNDNPNLLALPINYHFWYGMGVPFGWCAIKNESSNQPIKNGGWNSKVRITLEMEN